MKAGKNILSKAVCFLFLITCIWVTFNVNKWKYCRIIRTDVSGYYLYLPATLIYHDLPYLKFYNSIDSVYHPNNELKRYAIYRSPETDKCFIKYSSGVALFELPLFIAAQLFCFINTDFANDGYSKPFQLAVAFSTIIFGFLGLLMLRKFLLNYFSDKAVALSLLIISLGTNIFVYSAMFQGMSHIYLFFVYGSILYLTDRWYKSPAYYNSAAIGFLLGMATLTRPTDILIIIFPLLWGVYSYQTLKNNFNVWKMNWKKVALAIIFFFPPIILQMVYWKATTNHWVHYSYEGERFNFTQPHITDGLFSYRKGWFVYTPLALVGFLGFILMIKIKEYRFYIVPFALFFVLSIYVIFSWEMWYYGGGFGCRALIQSLALLVLPMTLFIEKMMKKRFSYIIGLVVFLGIALNLFQSWQYNRDIIHWDNMNKTSYWRVFGKIDLTNAEYESLYGKKEY